ncbi:hypothetical protein Daura_34160 [Dactylosporangium aurantiacum]|uniref:Uncharacterized protein n=1 Tax=Dactylosporangium aurantiacum TaxID=35754 RepID=A0A9Q9IFR9_9ACTN|nr:hypothetical protein [Dactylosporangium aurantiacum]MDG6105237.1 hypothetical protein [Dactylosporangium aurantiacum]UWZ51750.1 hypothetical protein Daura_34160 [Dactylosporangium aurantiacum]
MLGPPRYGEPRDQGEHPAVLRPSLNSVRRTTGHPTRQLADDQGIPRRRGRLGCIDGDVIGCISLASNVIPWAKVAKIPKIAGAIKKAYKAWNAFKEKLAWAKGILKKADDAATADDAGEAVADAGKADAGCNSLLPGTPVLMASRPEVGR